MRDRASSGASKLRSRPWMREVMAGWLRKSCCAAALMVPCDDGNEGVKLRELDLIGHPCRISVLVMDVIGRIVLTDGW